MANEPAVINKREDVLKKIEELYPLLSNEDRQVADGLHELAIEWDMKIGIGNIRGNAANTKKNYDITYSAKKPFVRSVFLFKICVIKHQANPAFGLKLKLQNIDKYRPIVESCPNSIKSVITNIKACKKCNPGCKQQISFTLDGIEYISCTYGGEIYENLSSDEWKLLKNIVIEEYKAHTTV